MVTPTKTENGSVRQECSTEADETEKRLDDLDIRFRGGVRTDDIEDRSKNTEETFDSDERKFIVQHNGRLYDIQSFFDLHPGGKSTLRLYKDRNLDKVLQENPHSKAAYHLFEEFALDNQLKYQNVEKLVNWDAPILWQVSSLKDRYWEWVNLPVHRPIRLFHSDILEYASITPWYFILTVWVPIIMYFIWSGCVTKVPGSLVKQLPEMLLSFGAGVLIWTIMEYFLHRKIFHFEPPHDSRVLITLHFLLHGAHHKAPFDGQRLLFPPAVGVLIAFLLWKLYVAVFPETMVHFIAAGTITGYLCYDLIHYYLHYGAPKAGSYLYHMKRNHNYHHFNQHDQGFGVSSKLWDYVFKTQVDMRQLVRPIEW